MPQSVLIARISKKIKQFKSQENSDFAAISAKMFEYNEIEKRKTQKNWDKIFRIVQKSKEDKNMQNYRTKNNSSGSSRTETHNSNDNKKTRNNVIENDIKMTKKNPEKTFPFSLFSPFSMFTDSKRYLSSERKICSYNQYFRFYLSRLFGKDDDKVEYENNQTDEDVHDENEKNRDESKIVKSNNNRKIEGNANRIYGSGNQGTYSTKSQSSTDIFNNALYYSYGITVSDFNH